jgi:hypothetical protein
MLVVSMLLVGHTGRWLVGQPGSSAVVTTKGKATAVQVAAAMTTWL